MALRLQGANVLRSTNENTRVQRAKEIAVALVVFVYIGACLQGG